MKNKKVLTVITAALLAASPLVGTFVPQTQTIVTAARHKPARGRRARKGSRRRRATKRRTNKRRSRKINRRGRKSVRKTRGLSDTAIAQAWAFGAESMAQYDGDTYASDEQNQVVNNILNQANNGQKAWIRKYGKQKYNYAMNFTNHFSASRERRIYRIEYGIIKKITNRYPYVSIDVMMP